MKIKEIKLIPNIHVIILKFEEDYMPTEFIDLNEKGGIDSLDDFWFSVKGLGDINIWFNDEPDDLTIKSAVYPNLDDHNNFYPTALVIERPDRTKLINAGYAMAMNLMNPNKKEKLQLETIQYTVRMLKAEEKLGGENA